MASGNSTGSSSNLVAGSQIRCYHNEIAPLRVVRHNGPRHGKRFYGCAYWPHTCGFFRWADAVDDDVSFLILEKDSMISELKHEKKLLEKQVKALTVENQQLEESLGEIGVECAHRRDFMSAAATDKRMAWLLILSWIFFAVVLLLKT